jgi:hypothetical protein
MSRILFDEIPEYGVRQWFHYDDQADRFYIQTEQWVEDIIEQNKADYNDAPTSWGEGRLVARIPLSVYWDLKKKGIADDDAAMKKWLEDPDNRFFRCRPGNL